MRRIYHAYWTWEDIGMWRRVWGQERAQMLEVAITFTGNAKNYGAAMMDVTEQFPIACQHNLTDFAQNRQAWIGHAACYLRHDLPEDIVREAWGQLTDEQRDAANAVADIAIAAWENAFEAKNPSLYQQLEIQGLSRWSA
jgi:hypothetical protein